MLRQHIIVVVAILTVIVVTLSAHATPGAGEPCPYGLVETHGIVRYIDVEGGCWQFEDDAGNHYQPISGPYYMYCDDVAGTLAGCLRPDLVSFCQVGAIVEVLEFVPDPFTVHGETRFIDVEGGCWQFLADDGTPYEPVCGPPEMYGDGVTGSLTAFELCGLGSFCMVGQLVEVVEFVADPAACGADLDGSGDVGFGDVLAIIGAWGPCPPGCPEDLDGSGGIGFGDVLAVIGQWGPCA
ncbi:MAG: hypothetical protein GY716_13710 [bacterium]|nr:hypothetical protein [bacterium]